MTHRQKLTSNVLCILKKLSALNGTLNTTAQVFIISDFIQLINEITCRVKHTACEKRDKLRFLKNSEQETQNKQTNLEFIVKCCINYKESVILVTVKMCNTFVFTIYLLIAVVTNRETHYLNDSMMNNLDTKSFLLVQKLNICRVWLLDWF